MRKSGSFVLASAVVFTGVLFTVSACQSAPPPSSRPAPEAPASADSHKIKASCQSSIRNTDVVWLSVTTVPREGHWTLHQERRKWKNVRQECALSEAANLLMKMPRRRTGREKSENA